MKKSIYLMLMLCYALQSKAQVPAFYLKYDEANGTTTTHEEISGANLPVNNQFEKPERVTGVTGSALRTDGFSTWVQTPVTLGLTKSLTFETWVVLESYPSDQEVPYANLTPSAIVSQTDGTNGFAMFINTFGVWNLTITINGAKYVCQAPNPFPLYSWTHVAATLDGSTGSLRLFLNGAQVAAASTPVNGIINTAGSPLIIGKSNIDQIQGIFLINALDAAYDETKIYASALPATTISNDFTAGSNTITTTGEQAIAVSPIRFSNDLQRPVFHGMPPANWTNEPHGMVSFNGKYHLFYQRTPNGPFKYEMHWGHMVSTDFVHWSNAKDALWPQLEWSATSGYDMKGIWSGDVVVNNGIAHAFYTSVNQSGPYNPGIGHATSSDTGLNTWTKTTPVIDKQFVNDFRDPYIFKDGATWVMIIGAALSGSGGLDCYTSTDLATWTHKSNFCTVPYSQMDIGSVIWEMPVFESIGNGKYILEVNPIGGSIAKYGPKYTRGVYWIGTYVNGQFTPDYNQPKMLDVIHGHLSPTVARNSNNQLTGIGIVDERRSSQAQLNAGWAHLYSLPRVWSLLGDNKTLGQAPAPELTSLRLAGTQQNMTNINVSSTYPLNISYGSTFELIATADTNTAASAYGVSFRISSDRSEITRLYFDAAAKNLVLDKSHSTLSGDDEEKILISEPYDVAAFGKPATFHIFMDNSVMDVFINEKAAFSARIYPTRQDSKGVELYSQGAATVFTNINAWSSALQQVPVTGISLNKTNTTVPLGKADTLVPIITPINATNKQVTWKSSDTTIATINSNGIISPIAVGNAVVTSTTVDGSLTATCSVNVTPPNQYLTYDFETGNLSGWTVTTGTAFTAANVCTDINWGWGGPFNQQGSWHFWGFKSSGDSAVGSMQTQNFVVGGDGQISFMIGGGNDINNLYLALCRASDNAVLLKATGSNNEAYTTQSFNAAAYIGTSCYIKVVDNATGGFGHINLDNIRIPVNIIHVTAVSLNKPSSALIVGKSDTLVATVTPSNAANQNVNWSSSNTAVATVNASGIVTALAQGTATITVTTQDSAKTATCSVTVTPATAIHVTGVSLNKISTALVVGKSDTLVATITPANATNKNVSWSSSNTAVATVNASGIVTALAPGTATITVTTQDSAKTATCSVTVTSQPYVVLDFETGNLSGWTVTSGTAFTAANVCTDINWGWGGPFNQQGSWHFWGFKSSGDGAVGVMQTQNFVVGGDGQISFMIGGGNDINNLYLALCRASDNVVLLKATGSNNEAYTTQSFNAAAYIGTSCYIKAVDNSTGGFGHINLDNIRIPVNIIHVTGVGLNKTSSALIVGKSDTLVATVTPANATNKNVSWSSSNTAVATVNASGIVTALAQGTATITVTTQDSAKTATCGVTVTNQPYVVLDFETGNLSGWTVTSGTAFTAANVCTDINWSWGGPFNQQGSWHFWGFKSSGDGAVGAMQTQNFVVGGDGQISFMIGGGNDINNLYLALCRASDNAILLKATGSNNEAYTTQSFNAAAYIGTSCYIKAVDNAMGGFGHINLDNIKIPVATSNPGSLMSANRNPILVPLTDDDNRRAANNMVKVYPVPIEDIFTIDLSPVKETDLLLKITTIDGRIIHHRHLSGGNRYILSARQLKMAKGAYIISVSGKSVSRPFKVIVH